MRGNTPLPEQMARFPVQHIRLDVLLRVEINWVRARASHPLLAENLLFGCDVAFPDRLRHELWRKVLDIQGNDDRLFNMNPRGRLCGRVWPAVQKAVD